MANKNEEAADILNNISYISQSYRLKINDKMEVMTTDGYWSLSKSIASRLSRFKSTNISGRRKLNQQ